MTRMVAGILHRDGMILLGRRSSFRQSFPDCWDLIGGHVEPGETNEAALVREFQEEARVTPTQFSLIASFDVIDRVAGGGGRLDVYRVADWDGDPVLSGEEHSAFVWLRPREAAALSDLALENYRPLLESLDG